MKNPIVSFGALRVLPVVVTPFQQNCLILWNDLTRVGAVVDPGGDVERIMPLIVEHQVKVQKIVLTHGHLDHAGGVVALQQALLEEFQSDTPVEGPDEADLFLLEGLPMQGRMFGMDRLQPVVSDRWVSDNDTVEMAGFVFQVRHCPGHTPGHVVFIQPDLKVAIVGDVLFRQSIGRTDFPYGDHAALLQSIQHKLLSLPDDIIFYCGHGAGSTIGEERRSNPFLSN